MTMIDLLYLPLVALLSWLDRQRGMPKDQETIPKIAALLGMGYVIAVLCGHWMDWQAIAITAGVAVLHNISFGQPLGQALTGKVAKADDGTLYEVWQFHDVLRENPWLSLILRGVMVGGAGVLALDANAAWNIALAFGVAFPLAAVISRYALYGSWGKNEYIRGALVGVILWAL